MDLTSIIKTAGISLKTNKLRTSLTVLGIIIGIAAIIIVFSAGAAIEKLVLSEVESFGTNIIQTEIKVPSNETGMASEQESASSIASGVTITTLTTDDMKDINELTNVKRGYSAIMSQKLATYKEKRKKSFLMGTNADFINIDKSEIDKGRFFNENEDEALARVVVIGSEIKEELFGMSQAVGERIKVGDSKYRVVGVLKERGAVFTLNFDSYIYLPIKTLQKKVMGVDYVTYMVHELYNEDEANKTADQARSILRSNHDINAPYDPKTGKVQTNKDDFRVVTMEEMMEILNTVTSAITILLLAIVGISLLVGGVGIMNIMYVVVNERTSEIGLRKAVGAKNKDILVQFLIESIIITILGGLIGVLIGILASYGISIGAKSFGLEWRFVVPLKAFITALIFSLFFGVIFGLYPAKKAAALDPITALKL